MKFRHYLLVVVVALFAISIFAYDITKKSVAVQYTVVAASPSFVTVNRGKHTTETHGTWVWSIENEKTKIRQDRNVSFSSYSQFPVGSKVQFEEFPDPTNMDVFVISARFILGVFSIFLALCI